MERDKKPKKKNLQNSSNLDTKKNHIDIRVNIGNSDNKNYDESVSIKEQKKEKEEIKDKIDDTDILIQQLKDLIKELNSKKQNLIDQKIDIPNSLFDLPDFELNSRQEILNLIDIIKDKISQVDKILLNRIPLKSQQTIPQQTIPRQITPQQLLPSLRNQPFNVNANIRNIPFGFNVNQRTPFNPIQAEKRIPPKGDPPKQEEPPKADEPDSQKKPEEPPKADEPDSQKKPEEPPKADEPDSQKKPEEPPKADEPDVSPLPEDEDKAEDKPPKQEEITQEQQLQFQKDRIDRRFQTINQYIKDLRSNRTPRGMRGFNVLERELLAMKDRLNLAKEKNENKELLTQEELDFATQDSVTMDNSIGKVEPAKAYFQKRGETLGKSDFLNLVQNTTKQTVSGGRPAFNLFLNGVELTDIQNNLPLFFNSDGNIYNDAKDNVQQTTEQPPQEPERDAQTPPAEKRPDTEPPTPPTPPTENTREQQLLEYRRTLYNTTRPNQINIVDSLNEEISQALVEDKLITLDVFNNIPSAIAYRRSTMRDPINIINKQNSGLVASPLDRPADPAKMPFLLYINGTLQFDNMEQQILYNEFGDIYSVKDFQGEDQTITFPYRPTQRQDLSVPEENQPDPDRRFDEEEDEEDFDLDQIPTQGFRPASNINQQVMPTRATKRKPIINPISTIVGSTRTTTGLTQEVTRKSEEGFFGQLFDYIEALFEDGPVKDELKQSQLTQTPLEP